jgi:hypothetical protein
MSAEPRDVQASRRTCVQSNDTKEKQLFRSDGWSAEFPCRQFWLAAEAMHLSERREDLLC